MAADAPLAALLCSIFVGPLGIQGWIIDPANPNYQGLGVHQRRISIALHVLLAIVIISAVILSVLTANAADKYGKDNKVEIAKEIEVPSILTNITYGALGVTSVVSFIIAIILLVRFNNK